MAIFINENTKVLVQGMTGSEGTKHTARMIKSGTKIVGGVIEKNASPSSKKIGRYQKNASPISMFFCCSISKFLLSNIFQ